MNQELKANASEHNLERINDILSKLEEQLKALKKQAKQAEDYRLLGEKIRKCRITAVICSLGK